MSANSNYNLFRKCIHLSLMLLMLSSFAVSAESPSAEPDGLKVQGNVSDEKGEPLVGAAIFMQGDNTVNAITDLDGNYTIVVPDKRATLVFTYIGFEQRAVEVDGRRVVNVTMLEGEKIDDAVVVAYGTQKRESVVASITTIAPQALKVSTNRSISNHLAGTVAGVLAIQRSGEPGYDNSTFWIRGISTFQGAGGNP